MKNIIRIFISILLVSSLVETSDAQIFEKTKCKSYATTYGLGLMDTLNYTQNGRYTALKLYEGDEIRMFKTVSRGLDYRAVVSISKELPVGTKIEFLDFDHHVLKAAEKDMLDLVWDFKSETTQRLIISIKIPKNQDEKREPKGGCVAIIFGVKK